MASGFSALYSQDAIILKHITTEEGLPQSSILDIKLDHSGFCWIVTEYGLVRYDGYDTTKVFSVTDKFDKYRVGYDMDGELYIKSRVGNIYRIISDSINPSYLDPDTTDRIFDANGRMFYDARKVRTSGYNMSYNVETYPDRYFTPDTAIYVFEKDTLNYFRDGHSTKLPFSPNPFSPKFGQIDNTIITVQQNRLTLIRHGKFVWSEEINNLIPGTGKITSSNFYLLNSDNDCYIFCGKALYKCLLLKNQISLMLILENLNIYEPYKIETDHLNHVYFIGTYLDGLYIVKKNSFRTTKLKRAKDNAIYSIDKIDENTYTANGYIINRKTGAEKLIDGNYVPFATLVDDKNTLWYTSLSELVSVNLSTLSKKHYGKIKDYSTCIQQSTFDKKIYLTVQKNFGVIDKDSIRWILVGNNKGFSHIISFLFLDSTNLLFATDKGLYAFDLSTGNIETYIPDKRFRTLYKDRGGYIWAGTYGDGYYLYYKNRFVRMPHDKQKSLANVHSFFEDAQGRLWMPTNNGLVSALRRELIAYAADHSSIVSFNIYKKIDGLPTSEFNGGCYPNVIRFADGMIAISSLRGIVEFNPDNMRDGSLPKNIYIDKITLDDKQLNTSENITLPNNFGQFEIQTIVPFMYLNMQNEIEYSLTNDGSYRWRNVSLDGKILFNSLKSGEYILALKFRDRKTPTTRLKINVKPALYESVWFLTAFGLAFIGLIFLSNRLINKRLRRQNEELEEKVKNRTEEQQEVIKELDILVQKLLVTEHKLGENLLFKEQLISLVLHDMRSPINYLKIAIDDLSHNIAHRDKASIQKTVDELREGVEEINIFSRTFFEWIYFQRKGIEPTMESVTITDIFLELSNLFNSIASRNENKISTKNSNFQVYTDRNILITILRNLMDNANKITRKGILELSCRMEEKTKCIIKLSDTGPGMPLTLIRKIEKAYSNPVYKSELPGYGYKLILDLLPKIDARIHVYNNDPCPGTSVEIMITVQ